MAGQIGFCECPKQFVMLAMAQFEMNQFMDNDLSSEFCCFGEQVGVEGKPPAGGDAGPFAPHRAHVDLAQSVFYADPAGPVVGFRYQ